MAVNQEIIDQLGSMSVLDLVELTKALQEQWGVSAAVAVAPAAVAPTGDGAAAPVDDTPTSFDVILTGAGDKKIQVIKVVREVTSLGLKEAKDLVDGAPQPVKQGLNKDDADALKAKLEAEGASVEIKAA